MKIEQELYEKIREFPKEEKKIICKLVEKIYKLKNKIRRKKNSVMFDRRYSKLGQFSDSNLEFDRLKQEIIDKEIELNDRLKGGGK